LTGAISAGVAEGAGLAIQGSDWFSSLQPDEKIFAGLGSRVGIGAVTGGVTSEIVNGQFLHGFGQGAWTAAYGFLFNEALHGGVAAMMTAGLDGVGGTSSSYTTIPATDPEAATFGKVWNSLALAVTVGGVVYSGAYIGGLAYMYPEAVLIGAGFAEGYFPPPTPVTNSVPGYMTGTVAGWFYGP
jgi:hypothetical protein